MSLWTEISILIRVNQGQWEMINKTYGINLPIHFPNTPSRFSTARMRINLLSWNFTLEFTKFVVG